jgi:hypothetical protein
MIPRVEAIPPRERKAPPQRLAYRFLRMMLALLLEATADRRSSSWHRELPHSDGIAPNQVSSHKYFARVVSQLRSIQSAWREPLAFFKGFWASFYCTEHRFEDAIRV